MRAVCEGVVLVPVTTIRPRWLVVLLFPEGAVLWNDRSGLDFLATPFALGLELGGFRRGQRLSRTAIVLLASSGPKQCRKIRFLTTTWHACYLPRNRKREREFIVNIFESKLFYVLRVVCYNDCDS